jgi:hypothetical protein
MPRNYHILPAHSGWQLKSEGAVTGISHHESLDEAMQIGTAAARRRNVALLVQDDADSELKPVDLD